MRQRIWVVEESVDRKVWDPISVHLTKAEARVAAKLSRADAAEWQAESNLTYRVRKYVPEGS